MFIDFKNRKLQSISRILLIIVLALILVFNFIGIESLIYDFDYLHSENKIYHYEFYFNLLIGFLIAFLLTNSIFEEKYAFRLSNLLISLAISIFTITILFLFTNKLNFYSKFDFILKRRIEKVNRFSFIDDEDKVRIYRFIVEKDTLYYSNFPKYGNKDKLEHKEILNGEVYKSFISKKYYIKY
jgi:hypothetical protein